jgi:murein DD-endopeptidase MepM/ murein hydrolase activator NlpD
MKKLAILLLLCVLGAALALAADIVHVVKKGETLSAISHKYHVPIADILRHNGLASASAIKIGQKLKIPSPAAAKATPAKPAPAAAKPAAKPAVAQSATETLAPATEKMDTILPEASLEQPDTQAPPVEPAKKQSRGISTKTKFFILFVVQTIVSALLAYVIALWVVNRGGGYKRGT